ncbi:MAG TPA: hypothetical protein VMD99_08755 [Terriglobales bacterium]|nr:hypothetical protein [Terriglobales bacterium]
MLSFYQCLLYLYPATYRHEFAEEMLSVFRDARRDVSSEARARRIGFYARETWGMFSGALRERVAIFTGGYRPISFARFDMRLEFRFPRATVVLMSIIFAGVILAMRDADRIQVKYGGGDWSIWPSLPWFLGIAFLLTCALAVAVVAVLFALRRTGAHRLESLETSAGRD